MKIEKRENRVVQTQEELNELQAAIKADGGYVSKVDVMRNGTISVNFSTFYDVE
ncbi:hypothetical protein [Salimicrobium flavidum]|uniref:Uncharacterized protein n=1 Tax=Salimicrobium flavidum TaxID=570947 RepID=A0A1N7JXE4_9BACI|nr:hypothetical protein [Salimicrobium flavidum]SIS53916.1 hypothetical protein SAMN05421687_10818 [Salimicrobium flavidum]